MGQFDPRTAAADAAPPLAFDFRPHELDSRPPLACSLGASRFVLTSGSGKGRKREVKVWAPAAAGAAGAAGAGGAAAAASMSLVHAEEFDSAPGLLYPVSGVRHGWRVHVCWC